MSRVPGLRRAFRLPWRTARAVAADVDEELRFHLEMREAELAERRGLDAAAARAEALRQFGDLEDARRYLREMDRRTETATRRRDQMASIRQDLVHALRGLRRSPAFAAVVVLALALGIGSATAIFSLVNAILLRPLPVPHAEGLVGFGDPALARSVSRGAMRTDLFSYGLYTDLRDGTRLVPALLAAGPATRMDVEVPGEARGGEPEHPRGRLVSGNYFEVLGVRAFAGRTLSPADDGAVGASPVAVISHDYWRRRFAEDPGAIGRTLLVNRTALTVVGIAPPGFHGEVSDSRTEIWIPLAMHPLLLPNQGWMTDRATNWLLLMGRPLPGVTPAQAGAELTALARRSLRAAGGAAPAAGVREAVVEAFPGARGFSTLRTEARSVLALLMALTGLVLLVVAANVANLLLARAAARQPEIGVRLALGAGRLRVVRHLLTESVLLGAAAGVLALLVVEVGHSVLVRRAEAQGGLNFDLGVDARVFAFAAGLSLVTAVLLGLVPAVRATRVDLAPALRSQARGLAGGAFGGSGRRLGLGKWLVIGQVAVSLVLLAGSGLLVRSVGNLQRAGMGVARDELLMVDVDAQTAGYSGERLRALQARLVERVGALPGVRAVSYSQIGLFSGSDITTTLQVPGFAAQAEGDTVAHLDFVGPGYFRAVGARLLRGRDIEPRDDARAARVAVINQTMARFYFGDADPVGRYLRVDTQSIQVVGVVADVNGQSLRAAPARRFYSAAAQAGEGGGFVVAVRAAGEPARVADAVRSEILALDPALRVPRALPLAELVRRSIEGERVVATVAAAAGALALGLAALGLYGVMTYTTVRRTGEFGLRMALGARPAEVTRMVLRETMTLFLLGAAVGVPAALGAARLLRSQLVGVGLVDLPTLAAALAVLAASAALAGYRPASRAGRVAPQVALSAD